MEEVEGGRRRRRAEVVEDAQIESGALFLRRLFTCPNHMKKTPMKKKGWKMTHEIEAFSLKNTRIESKNVNKKKNDENFEKDSINKFRG